MTFCDRCEAWTKRAHPDARACLDSLWKEAREIERGLAGPDLDSTIRFAARSGARFIAPTPAPRRRRERVIRSPAPLLERRGENSSIVAEI